jgi:hypothetical protein
MEQLVSRWTDFREIWGFLFNSVKNIQVSLTLDKKQALYMKTYDNVSLISSWAEKSYTKYLTKIVPFTR